MAALRVVKVALAVVVRVSQEALDQRMAASSEVVGEELASQVRSYVRREKLGYYPALELFRQQGGIDSDLIDAAQNIAWLACELAREQVQRRLRAAFSSVQIALIQCLAFTMPAVRPSQPDAFEALARHYTPNAIRVHLLVTELVKGEPQGMEVFVRRKVLRWMKDYFETVEVADARIAP